MKIFRIIDGHKNYEVSNYGEVRNNKTGYLLNGGLDTNGYRYISLKNKNYSVHRLVMMAFYGNSNLQVNHKDGDKANNHISNLEYCTASENQRHRSDILRKGVKEIKQYTKEGVLVKIWYSIMNIERTLGIGHSQIIRCCKGGRPTAGGYIWKYNIS